MTDEEFTAMMMAKSWPPALGVAEIHTYTCDTERGQFALIGFCKTTGQIAPDQAFAIPEHSFRRLAAQVTAQFEKLNEGGPDGSAET